MSKILDGFSTHITGITGNGKSYWVKKFLIPLLVKFKPVIIFDYKGEYAGPTAKDASGKWLNHGDIFGFFDHVKKHGMITKQVHVIHAKDNSNLNLGLAWINEKELQVSIILEESQFVFKDSSLSRAKFALVQMVRAGRSSGTDVIFVSQRTMDMPPDIRSQFLRRITFLQKHQSDIDVMNKGNGFVEAPAAKELDKREYLVLGDFPGHLPSLHGDYAQN